MGYSPDSRLILCVGELLPNKNHKMAISAMAAVVVRHPNAKLLIAGNGPEKDNLESLIKASNLQDHVELLGYRTNINEYHQISDLLVACSIREGLPINVIEAMMCQKPIIVSNNRGHRELIDGGKNGFIVDVGDNEKIANCICELLEDNDKSSTFANNAYEFSKRYSKLKVKEELRKIYEL